MPQDRKVSHDLREGLKKNLYREVACRRCSKHLGVTNKGVYGISVYCPECVSEVRKRLREP